VNPLPSRLTPELVERLGDHPRFASVFAHGSLEVELYAPRGHDPQTPHARDEVYVVVAGHGRFFCDDETRDFAPGELLFVPAGMAHRFLDFSDDFVTWVLFYGPEGGEAGQG
jgi:mannose-6-phosphate isomerase-like protein (cupin superfamily)